MKRFMMFGVINVYKLDFRFNIDMVVFLLLGVSVGKSVFNGM